MAMEWMWKPLVRRLATGRWGRLRMERIQPPLPSNGLKQPGLYLHVPFCRNLCPYCPYHKLRYDDEQYAVFEKAAHEEIDLYTPYLRGGLVSSLYIGGGTPTVHLEGLLRLTRHILSNFDVAGGVCIELNPADMDGQCLQRLREAGVSMVSVGVQSTSDRLLNLLGRNHDGATAIDAVRRAVRSGFEAVNADLMFALPNQTPAQWRTDLRRVLAEGVDQVSTYPVFSFPYSDLGVRLGLASVRRPPERTLRDMLRLTDELAGRHGLERCAVWSWLRPARNKFSSVSRHHYIGFGPSAASMLGSCLYVNTFDVEQYAASLPSRRPVALAMPMGRRMEMTYWLYWRLYELHAAERDFQAVFGPGASLQRTFGPLLRGLGRAGWLRREPGGYRVTERGAYWLHRLQNAFNLSYINRLWGRCRQTAWPEDMNL